MTIDNAVRLEPAPSMDLSHRRHVAGRLAHAMDNSAVDAVVALGAENCYYITGFPSMFAYQPISKAIAAIHYRDESAPTLVATEIEERSASGVYGIECRTIPIWMGIEDPYEIRPAADRRQRVNEISSHAVLTQVVEALRERGVDLTRVAVEVGELDHSGHEFLLTALGQSQLLDATPVLSEARRIKSAWEIEQLRTAVNITEKAITDTCGIITAGTTLQEILRVFHERVYANGAEGVRLAMITLGEEFGPTVFGGGRSITAKPGEVIKFDVGAMVNGYGADMARTFSLGKPRDDVRRRYDALRVGYDYILDTAAPGVSLGELFDGCMDRIHAAGLPDYARGHVGHSLGLAREVEEWPYIASGESGILEPGMVMCFETPYYAWGIGGLQCEDVVVVTADGADIMCGLSRDLVELSG